MLRFFCTEGGASKPLQIKKYIPLPSPCRRGLGRGSGRGQTPQLMTSSIHRGVWGAGPPDKTAIFDPICDKKKLLGVGCRE